MRNSGKGWVLVATLLASACSGAARHPGTSPAGSVSGVVLTHADLIGRGAGALLDAMIGRVPNMQVERGREGCPKISLRGRQTIYGRGPQIYVDGTPIGDTCVLNQLRVREVERVEVYATGGVPGKGYHANASGLILVFLTGGA